MDRNGLLTLCDYNAYANALVLDVASRVRPEDLAKETSPSHGSVIRLLHHMLDVESFFLCMSRNQPPRRRAPTSLADLRQDWLALEDERRRFVADLSQPDLEQEYEISIGGNRLRFPVWQMLTQSLVHSTHHRGELSILLTELGHPLPTLDIILQFTQESGQTWPA